MVFLRLDGWTIPILKGGKLKPLIVGDMAPSFNGFPLNDIRYRLDRWEFDTTTLDELSAQALVGMLMKRGQMWPFDDLVSYKGLSSADTPDGLLIEGFADGGLIPLPLLDTNGESFTQFRDKSFQAQPETTTNLLAATVGQCSGGWSGIGGGSPTTDTVEFVKGTDVTSTFIFSLGGVGQGMTSGAQTGFAGSTQYTFSVYFKTRATNQVIHIDDDIGVDVATKAITPPVTQSSTQDSYWWRETLTFTTNPAATTVTVRIISSDGVVFTLNIDNAQIEARAFTSEWQNPASGTRTVSSAVLRYPVDLTQARGFTASFWYRRNNTLDLSTGWFALSDGATDLNSIQWRSAGAGSDVVFISQDSFSAATQVSGGTSTSTDLLWHHYAITYAMDDGSGDFALSTYEDGVLINTVDSTTASGIPAANLPDLALLNTLHLGTNKLNQPAHGWFEDFRLLPYPVSSSWVAAMADQVNQSIVPGRIPFIRMTGDASKTNPAVQFNEGFEVNPIMGDEAYFGEPDSNGTWKSQHRRINFSLEEVPT